MPRIPTPKIVRAYQHNTLLPLLLRECRTLGSARNELRWLHDHAVKVIALKSKKIGGRSKYPLFGWRTLLNTMCRARSKGFPLQYILGDQPFGSLDIKCKKGVLIPRHDTETITLYAAKLVLENIKTEQPVDDKEASLRIVDLCTGTGCISLLLHAVLSPHFRRLSIIGIDISDTAIRLAKRNIEHNVRRGLLSGRALSEVSFRRGDVLSRSSEGVLTGIDEAFAHPELQCDVLISNPPYISRENFHDGTTARSVRIFEPELALVPPLSAHISWLGNQPEDAFYYRIAFLLVRFQARLMVLECGSRLQAMRVVDFCRTTLDAYLSTHSFLVEIWPVTGIDTDPYAVIIQRQKNT